MSHVTPKIYTIIVCRLMIEISNQLKDNLCLFHRWRFWFSIGLSLWSSSFGQQGAAATWDSSFGSGWSFSLIQVSFMGFMFSIHLCEVSRESAQEDHPSGAGRSVRAQEEELHTALVCVTQGSDSGRLGLSLHPNCEALGKTPGSPVSWVQRGVMAATDRVG